MPLWLIIVLVLFALFGLVLLAILVSDTAVDILGHWLIDHGKVAAGVITESGMYTGHGLHPADPCFEGKYVFTDHRGKERRGKFSRHCFEPYDFAESGYSFESVAAAYGAGAAIEVYYFRWLPAIHIERIRLSQSSDEA